MISFKKAVEPIVMNHDTQAEAIFSTQIENLQATLQIIVNEFNTLEVGTLAPADLLELVTYTDRVYSRYKSLVVNELHAKEEVKAGRKLNRNFIESSIALPSTSKLMQLVYTLGDIKETFTDNPALFELIKGIIHLNSGLLAGIKDSKFRIVLTDPAKIALYNLLHEYARVTNELSSAFTALYPARPSLVQVTDGAPFEVRAYHLLKADFASGKVIPRLDELMK